jgi:hypothetical protein
MLATCVPVGDGSLAKANPPAERLNAAGTKIAATVEFMTR